MTTKKKLLRIIVCVLILLVLVMLFVMYGPYKYLSDLYIVTAMNTSRHKYLATMFYSDAYIEKVFERNKIEVPIEMTEVGNINITNVNDGIDIEEINEIKIQGYILKVYDPTRISIGIARDTNGELLEEMVNRLGCVAGVNGGGYKSHSIRGVASGILIKDGIMVADCKDHKQHSVMALTDKGELIVGNLSLGEIQEKQYKNVLEFGPILIINGRKTNITGVAGGLQPRTAIGQTEDGTILLMVLDGRQISSIGATYEDMQRILEEHGAINAINLDGGATTSMFFDGEIVNNPSQGDKDRIIPNAILVK